MTAGRKILIVDDDLALRHSLAEQLQLHEEFATCEAGTAATACAILAQLSLARPGEDSAARAMRAR